MSRWLRNFILVTVILCASILSIYKIHPDLFSTSSDDSTSYRTESVSIGDISLNVSATGTLAAVNDVVVGAQLSGQVVKVYADFNDSVEQGQLLAKIDPASFASKVAQAQALADKSKADVAAQRFQIERSKLNYERSIRELQRAKGLYSSQNVSEDAIDDLQTQSSQNKLDWQQSLVQLDILKATLAANLASLEQAQIELNRTDIRAPISGFVINREIEAGQTVASSYNTPELFTLAKNLSEMEIEAYIDESDIGLVKEGQGVRFGVDAFADRQFKGVVKQIRKAPQNNSGVVSYVVVIATNNPNGILLPGMTANLDVAIQKMEHVQRVSNAAIRVASRYSVSGDNKNKGPLSRLKYLNLTPDQVQQIKQGLPKTAGKPSANAKKQTQQILKKLLSEVLTTEQKKLQQQIRKGTVKMGPLLVLRDGNMTSIQAQFGVSDDKYTAVITPDLSNETIVTQFRENK
ncbi:efflux RND transporter periplasmic adaptor subunit [Vibrio rarus]|uniref:efflux RND transporter periplasmic adaptor subunit n=1 Tax=Vibrio rarus TaxID=413403 RepID=UPI0021C2EDCD|nr:efflux RND transporter periplasmic adaptor subunit [Vibrio rarus]